MFAAMTARFAKKRVTGNDSAPGAVDTRHGELVHRGQSSCLLPAACDPPVLLPLFTKPEERFCQDAAFLYSSDLTDFQKLSASVPEPAQVDDQIDRRSQLPPDRGQRQVHAHQDHSLQTGQHVRSAVGMSRRE